MQVINKINRFVYYEKLIYIHIKFNKFKSKYIKINKYY